MAIELSFKKAALAVAGGAALVTLASAAPANATTTAYLTVDLDNQNGGTLDLAGPDLFQAQINKTSTGLNVQDTYYQTGVTSVAAATQFQFDYTFTVAANTPATAYALQTNSNGISNFSLQLVDLTNPAVIGTASTGNSLVVNASNLTAGDLYEVIVKGALTGTSATFNGQVSAVPLPGTLALFGTGLLGLAGLARRRRLSAKGKKVALTGAAAAVALFATPIIASHSADAAVISDTVQTGTIAAGETISFLGKDSVGGIVTASSTISGASKVNGVTATGTSGLAYNYDFSISTATKLDVVLQSTSGLTTAPTITIKDITTGATVATAAKNSSGVLEVVASLLNVSDHYALVVNTGFVKNSAINALGTVSAVPVPGALVLFGSSFVCLAAMGRRRLGQKNA